MTFGEGGTAASFVLLAIFSIVIAARAYTPEYAFHAYLFAAASVAAVFAIVNRYFERAADPALAVIDGKPNYNMGPVKFATVMAVFWGIAGFAVGLWIALELAFPALNLDVSFLSFGRLRPLHTSAVIFAFGGNVLIATSMYVVQRTCRARMSATLRRGSSSSATTFSSSSPAPVICSASPNQRNMRNRSGMRISGSPWSGSSIC